MMGAEKTLVNVNKGQDAYSVIGNYISNHVTAIEDMIAVIQINGVIINELYMVDVDVNGYFYWESDWWEGEEDVALLDFFPVSDAERIKWIPCSERLPEQPNPNPELEGKPLDIYLVCKQDNIPFRAFWNGRNFADGWTSLDVDAWMPLPKPYRAERRTDVDANT